jgi:hypothetical protein
MTSNRKENGRDRREIWKKRGREISCRRLCDKLIFVISGLRHGIDEIFALLGCYAVYIGTCVPTFRDNLSVTS